MRGNSGAIGDDLQNRICPPKSFRSDFGKSVFVGVGNGGPREAPVHAVAKRAGSSNRLSERFDRSRVPPT